MKFKIFYEIKNYEDYFIVEGDSIEEVRAQVDETLKLKGITRDSAWSVEIP